MAEAWHCLHVMLTSSLIKRAKCQCNPACCIMIDDDVLDDAIAAWMGQA
jgi:hypothetical protein